MNKWLSVSIKTPIYDGWYQTTVIINETQKLVMDLYYKNGKWLDNRRINMYDTYEIHGYGKTGIFHEMNRDEFDEFDWTNAVIAWMPLPEPYIYEDRKEE